MDEQDKIKMSSWKDKGFDQFMSRKQEGGPQTAQYLGGADFDALLDSLAFNRVLILKDLREQPQGNDVGKIYWDGANKKFKMWVGDSWADVQYTSTSTSSSSSSSSSSSTSTTSTSSSSSTSTSSTSTSVTI